MNSTRPEFNNNTKSMKNKLLSVFIVFLISVLALTAGCLNDNENDEENNPLKYYTLGGGMNDYVNASNNFTFEMYKQLVSSDKNNSNESVFFSPYSISTALGMAYEGARGQTALEMEEVLNLPTNDKERLEMVKELQSLLNKKRNSYDLSTANAYWLKVDEELKEEYRDAIESYYLAHGEQLDFAGDPAGSADTINSWVEKETNDRIKDLLSESDIDELTYLILTNAIYFKSDWEYQFDPNETENRTFTKSNGEEIETPIMHMCDEEIELNYTGNSEVQLLQLPYKDEELFMYILLPKGNNISSLESKLDLEYVRGLIENMSLRGIDMYLPRFKFEQKYGLKDHLSSMGMPTAFDAKKANFSGITPNTDLYISKVIHQSFIEVNEEGTDAAASTVVVGIFGGGPIEFKADHPFIFFMLHRGTGQILFMGKLEDPGA